MYHMEYSVTSGSLCAMNCHPFAHRQFSNGTRVCLALGTTSLIRTGCKKSEFTIKFNSNARGSVTGLLEPGLKNRISQINKIIKIHKSTDKFISNTFFYFVLDKLRKCSRSFLSCIILKKHLHKHYVSEIFCELSVFYEM